jgi:hypothetical protein
MQTAILQYRGAYLEDCHLSTPNGAACNPQLRDALWEATAAQLAAAVEGMTNSPAAPVAAK